MGPQILQVALMGKIYALKKKKKKPIHAQSYPSNITLLIPHLNMHWLGPCIKEQKMLCL